MISPKIIELQNSSVDKLIEKIPTKKKFVFKAPTGSGKTHMMADFMSKIIASNRNIIFIVSTLSQSGLDKQNEKEFKNYQHFGEFRNLDIHRLVTPDEQRKGNKCEVTRPEFPDGNVFILGNAKLNSGGDLFKYFADWLQSLKDDGKIIYLIRDEGHRATNNLNKHEDLFEKVIDFTATPKKNAFIDIEISEDIAQKYNLIKTVSHESKIHPSYTLETALDKFLELKSQYAECFGDKIRPCMLIQVSNEGKFEREFAEIQNVLNSSDEYRKLIWVYITGKDASCQTNDSIAKKKPTEQMLKDLAEPDDSPVDIVIFKIVAKEGWNVKRACMLYQERDTKSDILDRQVVGRTRRNPVLKEFDKYKDHKEIFMTTYIYGDMQLDDTSEKVELKSELKNKIKKEISICTTKLELKENERIDITNTIKQCAVPNSLHSTDSIFDLYRKYKTMKSEIFDLVKPQINSYSDWIWILENINKIKIAYNNVAGNYKNNIDFVRDEFGNKKYVSFPDISSYTVSKHDLSIGGWVWQKCKNEECDDEFSLDSETEKKWSDALKEVANISNGYYWGKNFLPNSEICFEYYDEGIHKSFPDFILKDKKQRIHIMEVKGFTESNSISIDAEDYEKKVEALNEGYKWCALLTGYIFYIPMFVPNGKKGRWDIIRIMRDENKGIDFSDWKNAIEKYGDIENVLICDRLTLSQFKQFIQE